MDGIIYVIDTGYAKMKVYNPKMGMDALTVSRESGGGGVKTGWVRRRVGLRQWLQAWQKDAVTVEGQGSATYSIGDWPYICDPLRPIPSFSSPPDTRRRRSSPSPRRRPIRGLGVRDGPGRAPAGACSQRAPFATVSLHRVPRRRLSHRCVPWTGRPGRLHLPRAELGLLCGDCWQL